MNLNINPVKHITMTALLVGTAMIGTVVLIKQLVSNKPSDVSDRPQHQRVIKKTN